MNEVTCLLTDDTAKTSFSVEPTNIILEPFIIPAALKV